MSPVTPELVRALLERYRLPLDGIHGPSHWARVTENGLRLARVTGADTRVIELFAVLHDALRETESISPDHGLRAAELATALRDDLFTVDDEAFEQLHRACSLHTDGLTEDHVTVQTCWDADRLDLGRVGIPPDRYRLCTDAARDPALLRWAYERSRNPGRPLPSWVRERWGLALPRG